MVDYEKDIYDKNRERAEYTFANINLLGVCNAKCFFCLGRDIPELLQKHNQTNIHFANWQNFEYFIAKCQEQGIKKLYLTGQNVDALQYHHFSNLAFYLMEKGFEFGIRTNGLLAKQMNQEVLTINGTVGYSIHTLNPVKLQKMMGWSKMPDWDWLLKNSGDNVRVSIVLNRHNIDDILQTIEFISRYPAVKYIQIRRISTDTRQVYHAEDLYLYERFFNSVDYSHEKVGEFHRAEVYEMFNKQVVFWRTVQTTVNSLNYFSDGTVSDNYFVVEGYLNNYQKKHLIEHDDNKVWVKEVQNGRPITENTD